jgi:hypothetical protein
MNKININPKLILIFTILIKKIVKKIFSFIFLQFITIINKVTKKLILKNSLYTTLIYNYITNMIKFNFLIIK